MLFHHDPLHSDARLDRLGEEARERWLALGGAPETVELGIEGYQYSLPLLSPSATAAT